MSDEEKKPPMSEAEQLTRSEAEVMDLRQQIERAADLALTAIVRLKAELAACRAKAEAAEPAEPEPMAADEHTWRYRVLRHPDEGGEPIFGIHEVHRVHTADGVRLTWTERPIVVGNSLHELRRVLRRMERSLHEPVIEAREQSGVVEG